MRAKDHRTFLLSRTGPAGFRIQAETRPGEWLTFSTDLTKVPSKFQASRAPLRGDSNRMNRAAGALYSE